MIKIKRALISVYDKRGVVDLAKSLDGFGVRIISTGGTSKAIKEAGIKVTEAADLTGFPQILGGRVKTLHPKIHGGILAKRTKDHLEELASQRIEEIDLVVVNLYPFKETIAKTNSLEEIIENIDIGGPTMIRSAAKNFEYVASVVNPDRYQELIDSLTENEGAIPRDLRLSLAIEAFGHTAAYDALIHQYLFNRLEERQSFPNSLNLTYEKAGELRYGENPHQKACFYREARIEEPSVGGAKLLQGKELSFNNILDLDAALETVKEFRESPAVVIIKHTTPCGVALGQDLLTAYKNAHSCDPVSAFGSVVGLNGEVDAETASQIASTFVEAVIAPSFSREAKEILGRKKNLRLLETGCLGERSSSEKDLRKVLGGLLIQDRDLKEVDVSELKTVSNRPPTKEELESLLFGFKVVKHVKSNAIVLANKKATVGIGAGQMSRVDSTQIAIHKAKEKARGSTLASDAFFPFRDAIDEAAKAGITAIIQPGGSLRDEEVIKAADEHNLALVLTGVRHFRH